MMNKEVGLDREGLVWGFVGDCRSPGSARAFYCLRTSGGARIV